ncbi:Hypothetical protein, putative [Bodo saltans]|uniref:ADF-H domain-containing protein n=1 Tax=Bodo saltans TaxID=75058 RepID=A0A0S4IWQ7_BODSA|nr:Hypothetical protein, putative [Bodo saltans]|eukprot:CUG00411.1 Hypothetical protein, putative [Bodo saltans]
MSADEVAQLWGNVLNTKNPLRWVISAVNDKNTGLDVVASGSTGLSGFLEALKDASGIIYAGFKVTGVDERGSVKSIRSQYVKVSMMTDDVPQLKRAKALQLKDAVDRAFSGASVVIDVSSADEIEKGDLERRLASAAGAHKPGRYDFEGLEDDLQTDGAASPKTAQSPREPALQAAPANTEPPKTDEAAAETAPAPAPASAPEAAAPDAAAAPAQEATAATSVAPAPVAAATTPAAATANALDNGPLTIDEAWSSVHDEKSPTNFLIVTFDGKDPKSAEIVAVGTGNFDHFKSLFVEDKPIYAGFRLRAVDDRGSVVSVRPKIVYVSMVGKDVKPVVRAQAGAVKPHFDNIFSGFHISLFVSHPSELTEEDLIGRLRRSGGAHQPTGYDFSGRKGQEV